MAYADFIFIESLDHCRREFRQLEALGAINGRFSRLGCYLLDGVFRLVKIQQSTEALCFLQWMHVPALEVFNQLRLQCFRIRVVDDADWNGFRFGHLRRAVTPRSGNDLKAAFVQRPHKQRREHALTANAGGQFFKGLILEDATRVGLRFGEYGKWKVAVFGSYD